MFYRRSRRGRGESVFHWQLKQVFTNEGRAIDWLDVEARRRPVVSAACDASEEHLGSLRGVGAMFVAGSDFCSRTD